MNFADESAAREYQEAVLRLVGAGARLMGDEAVIPTRALLLYEYIDDHGQRNTGHLMAGEFSWPDLFGFVRATGVRFETEFADSIRAQRDGL